MWALIGNGLVWGLLIFMGGQLLLFVGLVLWVIWTEEIRPRLIPKAEIAHIAEDLMSRMPDPEEAVFYRLSCAWYDSDGAAQIYWERVRKEVRRRIAAREKPPLRIGENTARRKEIHPTRNR